MSAWRRATGWLVVCLAPDRAVLVWLSLLVIVMARALPEGWLAAHWWLLAIGAVTGGYTVLQPRLAATCAWPPDPVADALHDLRRTAQRRARYSASPGEYAEARGDAVAAEHALRAWRRHP